MTTVLGGCSKDDTIHITASEIRLETLIGNKNLGSLAYEFDGKVYYNHLPHQNDSEKPEYHVDERYVDETGIYEVKEGSIFKYDLNGVPQTSNWPAYFTVQNIRLIGNNLVQVDNSNDSITSLNILKEGVAYLVRDENQYLFKYKENLYSLSFDGSELKQLPFESFDGMYIPTKQGIYYVNNGQLYLDGNALDIKTIKFNVAFGGIFYLTPDALIFRKDSVDMIVAKGSFETFSVGSTFVCVLDSEGVKVYPLAQ